VDQVGEEGDASRQHEYRDLNGSRGHENYEAHRHGFDALARANDRAIYEAVRMAVAVVRIPVPAQGGGR